jgi:hypothetical protein
MLYKNQILEQPVASFIPYGQMNVIINYRTLWLNLCMWTRSYLLSIASGLPNTQVVSDRMYQIPVQLGSILQLVFGQQTAERFINLLSTHIIQMQAAISAQKNNDVQGLASSVDQLYQNAGEIALFLSQINPFWAAAQWENLLFTYINMTFQQSTAMLSGDYARDVQIFDRIQYQTLLIGDYMANGIIQYLAVKMPQSMV